MRLLFTVGLVHCLVLLWRGLFGIDFIRDERLGRIFLIEINARQPAGSVFESHLQEIHRHHGTHGLTVAEAHVRALSGEIVDQPLIQISDGAQIIQRLTANTKTISPDSTNALTDAGYSTIAYSNTTPNSDLLRIQSNHGIMQGHNVFNKRGEEIVQILERKTHSS